MRAHGICHLADVRRRRVPPRCGHGPINREPARLGRARSGRIRAPDRHGDVPAHRRRGLDEALGGGRRRDGGLASPVTTSCSTRPSRCTAACARSSRARATAWSAAFAQASDAVAAALDVQRAFARGTLARGWRGARAHGAPHRRDSPARCRELLRPDDHPVRAHARDRARRADAHLRRDPRPGGRRASRRRRAPRSRAASAEGPRPRRADLAARASRPPARVPAVALARRDADEPARAGFELRRPGRRDRRGASRRCASTGW